MPDSKHPPVAPALNGGLFAFASIQADPEVASIGEPLAPVNAGLRADLAALNVAKDAVVIAKAQHGYVDKQRTKAYRALRKKAEAYDEEHSTKETPRMCALSVSSLKNLSDDERPKHWAEVILKEVDSDATPAELKPAAKAVVAAAKKVDVAQKALDVRLVARKKAQTKVDAAVLAVETELTRAEGLLQAKFPDDKEHVRSFFLPVATKKKKKAAKPGTDKGSGETPPKKDGTNS